MILHGQFAPRLSHKSRRLVALLALAIVPSLALNAAGKNPKESDATNSTAGAIRFLQENQSAGAGLNFPHAVAFEQGATRFADGDKITITEIRGTADTFAPGNIYLIKGTYALASRDRANLAAYTTAREAKDGSGASFKVQTMAIEKGTGTFTLFLPMSSPGWPHVSFYPVEGGSSFGGNYFGTGESTLKRSWATKDSNQAGHAAPPEPAAAGAQPEVQKFTVASPESKAVTLTQQYLCQIHAQRHVKIRALEKGYLEAIKVREGQQVKQSDALFKVHPILYQKRMEAEQAEAKLMEIELKDARKLNQTKTVSDTEVARAEAKLKKAQANADLAKAELDFATTKAPFDGVVGRLLQQEGGLVLEGEMLTTLSDNSVMRAYFNVPEARYLEYMAEVNQRKEDLKIELVLANGKKFNQIGKLAAIEADFNDETGAIAYRADFPNPDGVLRHGQSGTVLIRRVLNDGIVIPQRSTFEVLGKRYVYVVDKENVVHQREIAVENEQDDLFVVSKGISPADKILVDGVRRVHDGETLDFTGE